MFKNEADFEKSIIQSLKKYGWNGDVLVQPTEDDLLNNWAQILYKNNRQRDRLNNYPLTKGEMAQIIEQINSLKSPVKLNSFINSKTITIKRDNEEDVEHFGREISLDIYDRLKIAAGDYTYQIVQQPIFKSSSLYLKDRRGDLMLLINGMPVIHIELKRSGVSLSQAYYQIEKYSKEGAFTGIYSLVQIFVAMTPEDNVYFANPGQNGFFNPQYYFRWADFDNVPYSNWHEFIKRLLSIPMAHELVGFYTIPDKSDGVLKVLRSYQYYAVRAILEQMKKKLEGNERQRGGYVWHTTGSGKTLTSFKAGQLISLTNEADKVIYLVDRIVLGKQSLDEYRSFAEATDDVQSTEDTNVLITKLKSTSPNDNLIVTSIQKMSNIKSEIGVNTYDIDIINKKRIVFIIDEAHRSTFGTMLSTIKDTFPNAVLFGFTGTPIFDENSKKDTTTSDLFGKELHRYGISDGIKDGNVLGFNPWKVMTYKDNDLRRVVALEKSKAKTIDEVYKDKQKEAVFDYYMSLPMVSTEEVKGIEDYLPSNQYNRSEHREVVVNDILSNWTMFSKGSKFHAIFATSSIPEAIEYYKLFKLKNSNLNITTLFDPNESTSDWSYRQDAIIEILEDYNEKFDHKFTLRNYENFKTDIQLRLAHKAPYIRESPDQYLDILIVVDQMLTGYDSKFINTLYLDKVLKYESIVQAFSRTNRLYGEDKPFGTIRYYRKPHTMKKNIEVAFESYSGDKIYGVFVDKLPKNLTEINKLYKEIANVFEINNIDNFEKLPNDEEDKNKFAQLFNSLNKKLESVLIQGFKWGKYQYNDIEVMLEEETYYILLRRYKELFSGSRNSINSVPYDIVGYITEIDTGTIDADYMNNRYTKYIKAFMDGAEVKEIEKLLQELHKSFALLSQEQQKYAQSFLFDFSSGDLKVDPSKTLTDYIMDYQLRAKDSKVSNFSDITGIPKYKLEDILSLNLNEANYNEYGRFEDLKKDIDVARMKDYLEKNNNKTYKTYEVVIESHNVLKDFILNHDKD